MTIVRCSFFDRRLQTILCTSVFFPHGFWLAVGSQKWTLCHKTQQMLYTCTERFIYNTRQTNPNRQAETGKHPVRHRQSIRVPETVIIAVPLQSSAYSSVVRNTEGKCSLNTTYHPHNHPLINHDSHQNICQHFFLLKWMHYVLKSWFWIQLMTL